jgi:hypothetical protein
VRLDMVWKLGKLDRRWSSGHGQPALPAKRCTYTYQIATSDPPDACQNDLSTMPLTTKRARHSSTTLACLRLRRRSRQHPSYREGGLTLHDGASREEVKKAGFHNIILKDEVWNPTTGVDGVEKVLVQLPDGHQDRRSCRRYSDVYRRHRYRVVDGGERAASSRRQRPPLCAFSNNLCGLHPVLAKGSEVHITVTLKRTGLWTPSTPSAALLGDSNGKRIGYGAMQLTGRRVRAVQGSRCGDHIDTSDFYCPMSPTTWSARRCIPIPTTS